MNDENPRHLLFNDIFNNERITGNTSATNNINFYDLINNHEVFISNTIDELKNDLDKYNYVYNKDDIHKELPKRSSKPNIIVNTNIKKHSSRISSVSSQSSNHKKFSTHR